MASSGRSTPQATTAQCAAGLCPTIRRYHPSDLPRIAAICATVYGGTDTLPHTIQKQLDARPTTSNVLVAQQDAVVQGVVCAEQAGSVAFLFGLRVAEKARGNGLAKQLMAAICQQAAQPSHVLHLLTTTIPQNGPAQHILQQLGFQHMATVDRWPPVEAPQFAYEAAIGFTRNTADPEQPVTYAPGPNMLDHIPGARQLVLEAAAAAGVQPSDWVPCTSVGQLQAAVASIRQQQRQHHQGQQEGSTHAQPMDWLPWVYRVHPVQDCEWTAARVAAGEVFLLPAHPNSARPLGGWAGCVVLAHSSDNFRPSAGVLVVDDGMHGVPLGGFIAAALEFVASRTPHFVAYVDSGRCHSGGGSGMDPALRQLLPPTLMADGGMEHHVSEHMCFMVLGKDAAGNDECGRDCKL